ncbi:hypothetical protein PN498_06675 [Oscillatoria sp. CS-180]|uniref:hypothetical protein n=1 Tax=Oscillatoria sp. CS-180 TaxID=3021720 RepID=UPI00232BE848|nr:hypothetical protein [Oscillatoria sp. CS-180]MDB9525666.1 hypothetical protein [Oscillatoria sp. CS-180]
MFTTLLALKSRTISVLNFDPAELSSLSTVMSDNRLTQPSSVAESSQQNLPPKTFSISPLIRLTLLTLYIALTLPLPTLATVTSAPVPAWMLRTGILIGSALLYGGLSEQVRVDQTGIEVRYPQWIGWLLRRKWQLDWRDIRALKPRTTGQGGLVYYFTSDRHQQAYLLPMRIAGFAELLRYVEAYTQLDTQDVKPLAQPWMYIILLGFSVLLLLVDAWTLWTAAHFSGMS